MKQSTTQPNQRPMISNALRTSLTNPSRFQGDYSEVVKLDARLNPFALDRLAHASVRELVGTVADRSANRTECKRWKITATERRQVLYAVALAKARAVEYGDPSAMDRLQSPAADFAGACFDMNTVGELLEAITDKKASPSECKGWDITPTQYFNAIHAALIAMTCQEED